MFVFHIHCLYKKHNINDLVNFSINFNYVLSETRGAAAGKPPGKSAGKAFLAKTPGKFPFSLQTTYYAFSFLGSRQYIF